MEINIKDGYKITEVGVISDDWNCQILSTIISIPIQNGVFNDPLKKGRGYKLINVSNLYSTIPIDTKKLELFDATKDELARFCVAHGDIFFTRSSLAPDGIAHCNIYKQEENEEIVFDCHIIRVRGNIDKVDPFFLFRYCVGSLARKYLVSHAKTTTMTTIDQGVIANLPIPLPPLSEQKAIAHALSDVDNLITAIDQLITKKRNIKQGTMQQLLTGKKRLPGFSGKWEVRKFDNITKLITCGIAATPKYVREEIGKPFLSAQNVRNGKVVYDNYKYISHELFNQITKYSKPQKGDLLYTRVGAGIGEAGVIEDDFEFGIYVSLTLIRTDENQLYNYFLLHLLNSPTYKSIAKNGQFAGGGVQNLNVQIVK